jgi:hypothetical protein
MYPMLTQPGQWPVGRLHGDAACRTICWSLVWLFTACCRPRLLPACCCCCNDCLASVGGSHLHRCPCTSESSVAQWWRVLVQTDRTASDRDTLLDLRLCKSCQLHQQTTDGWTTLVTHCLQLCSSIMHDAVLATMVLKELQHLQVALHSHHCSKDRHMILLHNIVR